MFAVARQQRIKELLLKHKQIDVVTLAAVLGVTEVTVRRDLDKLEKENFAIKTHGGVLLNESALEEIIDSSTDNVSLEVSEIGEAASLLVQDRDVIFIGGGLTCQQVAVNLKNKQRVTVMTNDLIVAQELNNTSGVITVVTGGNTVPGASVLVGELALRALDGKYFNKSFISVAGISFTHGLTMNTVEEAQFYKQLLNMSNEIILIADYTKFGQISFAALAHLTGVQKVVTNKEVDSAYKEFFFQHNIKLYTPFEVEELTAQGGLGSE